MRALILGLCVVALAACDCSGTPGPDGGADDGGRDAATPDGGADAGSDAGADAGLDAGTDGGADAGTDAGVRDAGWPWSYDGGDPCEPEPPRLTLELAFPATTRTVTVPDGGSLQAALDSAQPGDELVLPAGATFTGNFELKPKTGSGWIVVRSSAAAQLPPSGTRLDPTQDGSKLARIVTPGSAPAINARSSASYWRFVGIEVGIVPGVNTLYNAVLLGGGAETTEATLPHHIVLDRCWVHGNDTGNARRGVALNGNYLAVVDSVVENFHEQGADSQALGGWNGGGPFAIVNDYLEGAGETVLFGGSDPSVPNLVPSDIAILHNTLSKRLTWKSDDPSYGGVAYVVKNTLELKNARRVWVEGNIIERSWPMGQVGYAVLFTPRNQDNTAPWSAVQDVTLKNNLIREAAGGVNLLSADDSNTSEPTKRIRVWNNLFVDVGVPPWGTGTKMFQFLHGLGTADCIDFQHLTSSQQATLAAVGDSPMVANRFTFSNNVVAHGTYGFFGGGVGEGTAALTTYMTNWTFSGNVIFGDSTVPAYPAGNVFPATQTAVGFVDAGQGNYRLAATSAYRGSGVDGGVPGVNQDAVEAAIR